MSQVIRDLPSDERPREKMARLGAGALSAAELLAIFLRTGTKGRSAIEIGRDLVEKHGSIGALGRLGIKELSQEHGLGLAKACQLAAAFEMGARVARETVETRALNCPERIFEYLAPLTAGLRQEVLHVLVLDSRLKLVHMEEVTRGLVNETLAHPREVLRPVILHLGHSFVLTHNHPSGDPTPSSADRRFTKQVAARS
ncbi:MAG: RadC family protein, partial [Verrucomicrobiales bacterium]